MVSKQTKFLQNNLQESSSVNCLTVHKLECTLVCTHGKLNQKFNFVSIGESNRIDVLVVFLFPKVVIIEDYTVQFILKHIFRISKFLSCWHMSAAFRIV